MNNFGLRYGDCNKEKVERISFDRLEMPLIDHEIALKLIPY